MNNYNLAGLRRHRMISMRKIAEYEQLWYHLWATKIFESEAQLHS
jgi:hypothetical protein